MQIHEPDNTDLSKPFYCNVCDARSSDMNLMVRHRAIHTDEKPFQCQHCDYKTRWKKDLKTHELIHTGQYVHSWVCWWTTQDSVVELQLISHNRGFGHLETTITIPGCFNSRNFSFIWNQTKCLVHISISLSDLSYHMIDSLSFIVLAVLYTRVLYNVYWYTLLYLYSRKHHRYQSL